MNQTSNGSSEWDSQFKYKHQKRECWTIEYIKHS